MKGKLVYFALSLFVILLFYVLPYSVLYNHGFEITIFWLVITLTWMIVTNAMLLGGKL